MAVTSDPSPFTSVTASPMESHEADELPIELKIPLPPSSACSEHNEEEEYPAKESVQESLEAQATMEKDIHPDNGDPKPEVHNNAVTDMPETEQLPETAMSLEDLACLLELEVYQKRRTITAQAELKRLRLSCGLDKRLISTFTIAYGHMIDQYKTDDQSGFAGLFEACEQLKASCDSADRSVGFSGTEIQKSPLAPNDLESQSFFQMLPLQEQEVVLAFLDQIRIEPNYLSDRISSMSPTELTALTSTYHPAGIDFSILQNHSHGKSQAFSRDSQMMKLSRRMDNLHRFYNQDPFFSLLYGVFDSSARPGSREHTQRLDIWSTVCARNMVEGFGGSRLGTDEFAIASLDAFASFQDWTLKPRMETYLMRLLVEGSFLLEISSIRAVNFKEPLETHNAKAAIAEADFFESALTDLFELLTAGDFQQAVPADVLAFAHALLRKIEDPKLRLRAQQFIVIRWYFATFISSIVVYPEVRGLMMTQHIGETARRLILQKLVVRMQERVFDVILPWNNRALVKPDIRYGIMAIFDSFEPPFLDEVEDPSETLGGAEEASSRFLMLTPLDFVGLVQALCPNRTTPSNDLASTGPISDRPSTAGSSTLVARSSAVSSAVDPSNTADIIGNENEIPFSLNEPPAKEEGSHVFQDDQLKKAPAKPMGIAQEDVDAQLRRTCQTLRVNSASDGASESGSSPHIWTFLYYSADGLTLSMVPKQQDEIPVVSVPHVEHSGIEDDTDTINFMRTALVPLLMENEELRQKPLKASTASKAKPLDSNRDPLEALIAMAMNKAQSALNFGEAHTWWNTLKTYRLYLASNPFKSSRTLLMDLSTSLKTSIDTTGNIAKECQTECRSLDRLQIQSKSVLARLEELRNGLRVKMWYVSDVRHSATYEEALYVTRALRSMASLRKPKQAGSIQNWARQRLRGSNINDRAEVQTLEAMVAPKDQGGLPKLADEQVELTSRWLTRNSIENFCKGEERIHRFCYEVHRSVDKIAGTSLVESPVLWSSNLFKRERISFDTQPARPGALGSPFNAASAPVIPYEYGNLHSPAVSSSDMSSQLYAGYKARSPPNSFGGFWSGNHPSRGSPGLGLYGNQPILPPTPTSPPSSWSSNPFISSPPLYTSGRPRPFNSPISPDHSRGSKEGNTLPAKSAFAKRIRKSLCSLLISDLGYLLWNQGSETDVWVNTCFAQEQCELENSKARESTMQNRSLDALSENHSQRDWTSGNEPSTSFPTPGMGPQPHDRTIHHHHADQFPLTEAYTMLLRKMSLTHDPYAKLNTLYELEDLISKSMDVGPHTESATSGSIHLGTGDGKSSLRSKSIPMTKATSLEETIANCTERRAGTMRSKGAKPTSFALGAPSDPAEPSIPDTDNVVSAMLSIFRDRRLRSTTLFRDLQYIAAFIPSETLDQTAQGKAFWDAGLAALALKEKLCESMISRANTITAYHISPRNSLDPAADNALASTTLRDAAELWLITAKEGSPIAARELGLFYLTHPELLPRVTTPFSKAKDVFRSVVSNDMRAGDKERGALDPHTFAVVFHWMEVAANGGDKDARDFLKGNGDLSGGR